jgi:hypothetical protein
MRKKQIQELRQQEKSYQDRLVVIDYAFSSEEERNANLERLKSLKSSKVLNQSDIEQELNRLKRAYLENRSYLLLKIIKKKKSIPSHLMKFENNFFNARKLECIAIEDINECIKFDNNLIVRICQFINGIGYDDEQINNAKKQQHNNRPQIEVTITKSLMKIRSIVQNLHKLINSKELFSESMPIFVFKEDQLDNNLYFEDEKITIEFVSNTYEPCALNIKKIEWNAFENIHHLTMLTINNCLIVNIESRWFINAGNSLTKLWLCNNRITKIRSNDLQHL